MSWFDKVMPSRTKTERGSDSTPGGTKLDLARAYMDMGDPKGARRILSEVLSEGSPSQKQEAQRLMDALPG